MSAPDAVLKKHAKILAEQEALTVAPTVEPVDVPASTDTPVVVAEPVAPVTVDADIVVPAPVTLDPAENRLKTAQGIAEAAGKELREFRDKYDRDIKEIKGENDSLRATVKEQLDMMERFVKQAQAAPESTAPEPNKPSFDIPDAPTLTASDNDVLEAYEGLLPVFQKVFITKQEIGPLLQSALASLEERIAGAVAPVKTQVDTIVKTDAERRAERLVSDVNALLKAGFVEGSNIPNCVDIDNSPEFAQWLKGMTDLSGNSYVGAYQDAVSKTFDAKLAARIQKEFLLYSGGTIAPTPPANAPTTITDPVVNTVPTVSAQPVSAIPAAIEDMIAPPRSNGGDIPTGRKTAATITQEQVLALGNLAWKTPTPENNQAYVDALKLFNTQQAEIAAGKR